MIKILAKLLLYVFLVPSYWLALFIGKIANEVVKLTNS